MDKMTILELLIFIEEGISLLKKRSEGINSADDFLFNDANMNKFEASIMRLQIVAEALQDIDKRDKNFLLQVATKEYWCKIIRMRDLISHHYADIQADIIFSICKNELDELEQNIQKLKEKIL